MSKDSLSRAWCEQLNGLVDIVEARQAFFQQAEPRQTFVFRCPDAACRAQSRAPVTGIAYSKPPQEQEYKVSPHFRRGRSEDHRPDCPYMASEVADGPQQGEEERRGENPNKTRALPNELRVPPAGQDQSRIDRLIRGLPDTDLPGESDADGGRRRSRAESDTIVTRHFQNIVHAYDEYHQNKTDSAERLNIPGFPQPERTFRQWFQAAKFCKTAKGTRIWFGVGRLHVVDTGFAITCKLETPEIPGADYVALRLDAARTELSAVGRMLEAFCRRKRDGDWIRFFVLGTPVAADKPGCLDITCHSMLTVFVDEPRPIR